MFKPEKFRNYPIEDRETKIEKTKEILRKVFGVIKTYFNLSEDQENILDNVLENLDRKIKGITSAPVLSMADILGISNIKEYIEETAGRCYINPYTLQPDFNVRIEENDSPISLAEKITHEILHLLGIFFIEVVELEEEKEAYQTIIDSYNNSTRSSYEPLLLIKWKTGPLEENGIIFKDPTSEMKILVIEPPTDYKLNIFYESAVDYFSKKIIRETLKNQNVEFTAGYDTRYALQICLDSIAFLKSKKNQKSFEENVEDIEKKLKSLIIKGDIESLKKEINEIKPNELLNRLKEILPRFDRWIYKDVLERAIEDVGKIENLETFDLILEILDKFCLLYTSPSPRD